MSLWHGEHYLECFPRVTSDDVKVILAQNDANSVPSFFDDYIPMIDDQYNHGDHDHVAPKRGVACPQRNHSQVCIFGEHKVTSLKDDNLRAEAATVLLRSFPSCITAHDHIGDPSVSHIADVVRLKTNYEVTAIYRITNRQRKDMYRQFAQTYGIPKALVVFHGTTRPNATKMAGQGFRASMNNGAKCVRGIHSCSTFWGALAHATPCAQDSTQTVVIANLLPGPTAVAEPGVSDFGTNARGEQIMTTTNTDNTSFCAMYEDQLLVTHLITVRYVKNSVHTPQAHDIVRTYHAAIWESIQARTRAQLEPDAEVVPLVPDVAEGDPVWIHGIHPIKPDPYGHGWVSGVVKKKITDSKGTVRYLVDLIEPTLRDHVRSMNKTIYSGTNFGQPLEWVCCLRAKLYTLGERQSHLGKRKSC